MKSRKPGCENHLCNIFPLPVYGSSGRFDKVITSRRNARESFKQAFMEVEEVDSLGIKGYKDDNLSLISILIDLNASGWKPSEFAAGGIEPQSLGTPVYLQPHFVGSCGVINRTLECWSDTGITAPNSPALPPAQGVRVLTKIEEFWDGANECA